jgi:GTP cyclohydrolase I
MNSPPLNPKPKSALPPHLTNNSPLGVSQETRDRKEREKLFASIESSSTTGRLAVDLDAPNSYFPSNKSQSKTEMNGYGGQSLKYAKNGLEEEHARDPRDEAGPSQLPSPSRPESPFTQYPTIDFDGLSWPSETLQARNWDM